MNCNRATLLGSPVFAPGYNDKIVTRKGQKDAFYKYIIDNPRRYLARVLFPDYFKKIRNLTINGIRMSLYGNLFLLNNPYKVAVRFSRKFSQKELGQRDRVYDEAIRSGGVLVSPFIHPNEKEIKSKAITEGGCVIQILLNGFSQRFKPSGADFELCAQGRLLLIAPTEYNTRKIELIREMALNANKLAEIIARFNSNSI